MEGFCKKFNDEYIKKDRAEEGYKDLNYFEENVHGKPDPKFYMQQFPEKEKTHFMMFEDCSEGTPISPAFATKEDLARWLTDSKTSAMGESTATYEQWLKMINQEWCMSGMIINGKILNGVEACSYNEEEGENV